MTKNERHQMNLAAYYRAAGYRDLAARTLAIIHRSARRSATDRDVTDARADAFRLHYLLKALDEAIEADALERARESDALYQAALARIDAQAVRS